MLSTVGLRAKIFILVTSVVVIAFVAVVWLVSRATIDMAERNAFSLAHETADRYRNEITSELQSARVTAQTLAAAFAAMNDNGFTSRRLMDAVLQNVLKTNPRIVGLGVAYEPNALDGQDKIFAGRKPQYDASGRYAPYWHKLNRRISVEPIHDLDISPWYLTPKTTKREYIADPYIYQSNEGKTRLTFPILRRDGFAGVVASDLTLDKLQRLVSLDMPNVNGVFITIFTNSGVVAAHPDNQFIGKNYAQIQADDMLGQNADTVARAAQILRAFDNTHPVRDQWDKDELKERDEIRYFIGQLDEAAANFAMEDRPRLPPDISREVLKADPLRLRDTENVSQAIANGQVHALATDTLYTVFMPIRFSEATKPWSVAVSIPMDNILADAHEIRNSVMALCGAATALVAAILWLIAGRISRPILLLAQSARCLGEGRFDVRPPEVTNDDEIGALARAFRVMGEKISAQVGELNRYARELKEKNENLKRLNTLKDEFLANTSHELRTPLNGIIGIVESMMDGATGEMTAEQKYNLAIVASSGKRLANLVGDILDFAKLKNREIILQKQPVDLKILVDTVLTFVQPLTRGAAINLVNELDDSLPPLDADLARLEQILYNLIGNAVKFTDQGEARIRARVDGDMAVISVADSGIGIPKEKFVGIFESFEQVDGSIARARGGAGLGLSITKKLVELHGGTIKVESELGHGSVFTFSIPISLDAPAAAPATTAAPIIDPADFQVPLHAAAPSSGERILVVDDELVNIQALVNLLSLRGYAVTRAFGGEEALTMLENGETFDLVLLDVMMPKMSGYEVCRCLREQFSLFELPVLMLTAKNQFSDVVRGFQSGANDYVRKPFDKTELLARMATLLRLKRAVADALENERKFEDEKRKRLAEENLREITRALTSTLRLDDVLNRVLAAMARFAPFTASAVLLREDDAFVIKSQNGFVTPPPERLSAEDDPFLRRAIDERRVVTWPTASTFFKMPQEDGAALFGLPILYRDEILGAIVLACQEREFAAELLLILATQAGVAIQNAILFEKVSAMATTDALTGLYNRRHFFELAGKEFARFKRYGAPMSMFMLDIDHFKRINDTFGHAAGDQVLRRVAAILTETLRTNDISGRYGGEEFAVVLPDTPLVTAGNIAERLRQAITNATIESDKGAIRCTVSIGVSVAGDAGLEAALAVADKCLYTAKENGRNRVVVASKFSG
ncbi:MAG: diguanylate cyclase [Desulfobulbaceae bacterium]|jgi:diguanylate cyclase (GGDEF)-like protein|nr:diguanylate cyclase [Desulfobulbaceae bacterium]